MFLSSGVRFSAYCGDMKGVSTGNGRLESFKQVQEQVRLWEVCLQLRTDAGGIEHAVKYMSRDSSQLGHNARSPSLFVLFTACQGAWRQALTFLHASSWGGDGAPKHGLMYTE